MSEHTPGPWRSENNYGRFWVSAKRGKLQIADVSDIETGKGETDTDERQTSANARLIAAAPELYAACKELIAHGMSAAEFSPEHGDPWDAAIEKANAAIAKVRSRSLNP